jgi:drug/metabolite transporter (DMT)-like permease
MGHLWVLVALLSATGDAVRDLAAKRVLTKNNSMFFTWLIFALPLPAIYAWDIYCGVPHPAPAFYSALFSALPLEILAQVLYMHALRLSPLSIVAPLLSLTPVFAGRSLSAHRRKSIRSVAAGPVNAAGAYILNAGA